MCSRDDIKCTGGQMNEVVGGNDGSGSVASYCLTWENEFRECDDGEFLSYFRLHQHKLLS